MKQLKLRGAAMTRKTLSMEIQKRIAELYEAKKPYATIVKTVNAEHKASITHCDVTNVRDRFKLKPRHVFAEKNDKTPKPRVLVAPKPEGDMEQLIQNLIIRLRSFTPMPLAILIEPKAGTYRVQMPVEYEGKVS